LDQNASVGKVAGTLSASLVLPVLAMDATVSAKLAAAFLAFSREKLSAQYLPRLEDCVARLTPEQLWWRGGSTCNSVGHLLLHLNGNVRQWILEGVGGLTVEPRRRAEEFTARQHEPGDVLLRRLTATLREADVILQHLSPEVLLKERQIQGHDVSVLEAVFHVVEHFSTHVGQVIFITKLLRGEDLGYYAYLDAPEPHTHKP